MVMYGKNMSIIKCLACKIGCLSKSHGKSYIVEVLSMKLLFKITHN